jgi:hypothetical protein
VSLRDFLACLTEALEGAGIESMITGSVASTYFRRRAEPSRPRAPV